MQVYKHGDWFYSSPIYAAAGQEEIDLAMKCPHRKWGIFKREIVDTEEGPYEVVGEFCERCKVARRSRYRPKGAPGGEPETTPGLEEVMPDRERHYNMGAWLVITRQFDPYHGAPPTFTVYVEKGGIEHTSVVQTPEWIFAMGAYETMKEMRTALRMGPSQYLEYRNFRERRKKKEERALIEEHVQTLFPVAQAIGPEALASAEAQFLGAIPVEQKERAEAIAGGLEAQADELERRAAEARRTRGAGPSMKGPGRRFFATANEAAETVLAETLEAVV